MTLLLVVKFYRLVAGHPESNRLVVNFHVHLLTDGLLMTSSWAEPFVCLVWQQEENEEVHYLHHP